MVKRISPEDYFKEKAIEEIRLSEKIYKIATSGIVNKRLLKSFATHALAFMFGIIIGIEIGKRGR